MMHVRALALALAAATLAAILPASADDNVKITIGQRGNWDTSISHLGSKAGIFKKQGLVLEMLYTSGSGETLQPVIAGAAEFGAAVGTQGAMAAFAKGAPVRIIGAEATGAADYWYAKTSSPIKTLADTNGRTIAFSTQGSSTQSIVRAFIDEFKLTARPVSTGNPAATLTAVMTNQVDVGWAAPPFGLDQLDKGEIRRIATGNDAAAFKGQTVRLNIANAGFLEKHKDVVNRYMKAYRETVDYMYKDPAALKIYADWLGITEAKAKRTRDDFFPPPAIEPDKIVGLDMIVKDAVALKFTAAELSKEQLAELIQIPPR